MKLGIMLILFLIAIIYIAKPKITFKPFTISFGDIWMALAVLFVTVAGACYYYSGYKKGQKDAIEKEIELFQKDIKTEG
jgi:amino acid transporter